MQPENTRETEFEWGPLTVAEASYEKLLGVWKAIQTLEYFVFSSTFAFFLPFFWSKDFWPRPALDPMLVSLHNELLVHLECFAAVSTQETERGPCRVFSHENTFTLQPAFPQRISKRGRSFKISKCWALVFPPSVWHFWRVELLKSVSTMSGCLCFLLRKKGKSPLPGVSEDEGKKSLSFCNAQCTHHLEGEKKLPSSKLWF